MGQIFPSLVRERMDGYLKQSLNHIDRYDITLQSGNALESTHLDGFVIDIILVALKAVGLENGWKCKCQCRHIVGGWQ